MTCRDLVAKVVVTVARAGKPEALGAAQRNSDGHGGA